MQAAMREVVKCMTATAEAIVEHFVALHDERGQTDVSLMRQLLVHLMELISRLVAQEAENKVVAKALEACADIHLYSFHDGKAVSYYERVLDIRKYHYGPNHVEIARTLGNLGNAYGALGDAAKQKELLEQALAIKERHYGRNHVKVSITLGNLSNAYGTLGDAAKQKELLERALAIQERYYGPEHVEVAITLGNLGNAYGALGDAAKEKELLERAVRILDADTASVTSKRQRRS